MKYEHEIPLAEASTGEVVEIVLETVDRISGTTNRPNARQAYRIKTEEGRLVIRGASERGQHVGRTLPPLRQAVSEPAPGARLGQDRLPVRD